MCRIWTFIAAVCLTVGGLVANAAPASAGGVNIVVYERYQRVTILSRHHHGFRHHGYRLHRPGYVFHNGLWFSPRSMRAGVIVDVPIPRRHVVQYGGSGSRHYIGAPIVIVPITGAAIRSNRIMAQGGSATRPIAEPTAAALRSR